jgi:hypothetical protein
MKLSFNNHKIIISAVKNRLRKNLSFLILMPMLEKIGHNLNYRSD